jgi:hypothetical protein
VVSVSFKIRTKPGQSEVGNGWTSFIQQTSVVNVKHVTQEKEKSCEEIETAALNVLITN